MADLTNDKFWSERWTNNAGGSLARPILLSNREGSKVLSNVVAPLVQGGKVIELGAAPGSVLVQYNAIRPDLILDGVDISQSGIEKTHKLFQQKKIKGKIHLEDFRKEDTALYNQYDLVCSHGLIEHFDDFQNVIRDHFKFVKDGGRIFISIPNYSTGIVKFLLSLFSKETMDAHNFDSMDLEKLKESFNYPDVEIEAIGAYGGPMFPHSAINPGIRGKLYRKFCQAWNITFSVLGILTNDKLVPRFWNSNYYIIANLKK